MDQKRIGLGVAAVAAVAIAAGLLLRSAPEPVVAVSPPPTTVAHAPSPTAVPTSQPDAPVPAATAASSPPAMASKAAEFNRLISTGKPVDAHKAYRLAATCEADKAWMALAKQSDLESQQLYAAQAPRDACGDLSPGQVASRFELLRIALDAGVHGALGSLLLNEGPYGILHTIPDGLQWRATELAALDASVKTADPYALISMSSLYSSCHNSVEACEPTEADMAKALMYWVASMEAMDLREGRRRPQMVDASGETVVERYSKLLPPDVARRAIDDGKAFVAAAHAPR